MIQQENYEMFESYKELNDDEKAVFVQLHNFILNHGRFNLSNKDVSEVMGISCSNFQRILNHLCDVKLLKKSSVRYQGGNGKWTSERTVWLNPDHFPKTDAFELSVTEFYQLKKQYENNTKMDIKPILKCIDKIIVSINKKRGGNNAV